MDEKALKINLRAPLNEFDTETQTYGCRANNPDICKNNGIPGLCAFAKEDHICLSPSKAWKKQYQKLLSRANIEVEYVYLLSEWFKNCVREKSL